MALKMGALQNSYFRACSIPYINVMGGGGTHMYCVHFGLFRMTKINLTTSRGGGGTRMSRGYQAHPKIHIINVAFQDKVMYARTSFRGAKTCKIGKKGVFLVK